jgi:CheY-like chemotaxis protein
MNNNKPHTKILIIDDDPDFLKLTTLMLKEAPYNVVTANDPKEGKEKLLSEKPDLILLDIMMDSMFDGYSLCNDIKTSKEYEKFKDTPIIFVSAVKKISGSRFAIDLNEQGLRGPDDYLDKPVQADELIARINKLLNI